MTALLARPLQLGDQDQLIELFETVFGHTVTPLMWAWKYLPPWTVRPYCWVGVVDEQVIGYFGAVPARGWIDGREVPFFQFADFMVHPDYRRKFDYFALGLDAVLNDLGSDHPEYLIYGFSDHRAFLGFRRSGLGDLVEKATNRYVRTTPDGDSGGLEIRDLSWDSTTIDTVWENLKDSYKMGIVRDRQYLTWRYSYHPVFRYRPLALYRGDRMIGWFVIGADGPGKNGRPDEVPVVDMFFDPEITRTALNALAAHVGHDLVTWIPDHVAGDDWAEQDWGDEKETGTHVYHFTKDAAVETSYMRDNLFYTMGDVDWW